MSAPQHITPAASVRHPSLDITDEQEANLRKLAAYLLTLPVDYPDFEMVDYTSDGGDIAHVAECGTAACAAGHGPLAGVDAMPMETWRAYSFRAFARNSDQWHWVFSGYWHHSDNTAHGAAARILWMLEHGVPSDSWAQASGYAPLCYAVQS